MRRAAAGALAAALSLSWAAPAWGRTAPAWPRPPLGEGVAAALVLAGDLAGPVTGRPDAATGAALVRWSRAHGGRVSEAGSELLAGRDPLPVLLEGARGRAVTLLQDRLDALGHRLAADGAYGSATLAAVRAFQTSRHLRPDGKVGIATWRALLGAPYVVMPGETLIDVADAVGLTAAQLTAWNPDAGPRPRAGSVLYLVPPPLEPSHRVVGGSTAAAPARRGRVAVVVDGLSQPPAALAALLRADRVKVTVAVSPAEAVNAADRAVLATLAGMGEDLELSEPPHGLAAAVLTRAAARLAHLTGALPVLTWAGLRPGTAAVNAALATQSGVVVGATAAAAAAVRPGEIVAVPGRNVSRLARLLSGLGRRGLEPVSLTALLGS